MYQTSPFAVDSKIHCLSYGRSVVKLSVRESRKPSPVLVKKMKTNNTTKFKSWELRDTTVDTESVLTCLYTANFIPVLKIEKIRAVFEFIKNLEKKFIVNKSQAPSTRIRIFLNPQLVLSGLKNFHVHTYPYSNRICPSTRILIRSSTQDSSENIGNRACVVVAVLNTVIHGKELGLSCDVTGWKICGFSVHTIPDS